MLEQLLRESPCAAPELDYRQRTFEFRVANHIGGGRILEEALPVEPGTQPIVEPSRLFMGEQSSMRAPSLVAKGIHSDLHVPGRKRELAALPTGALTSEVHVEPAKSRCESMKRSTGPAREQLPADDRADGRDRVVLDTGSQTGAGAGARWRSTGPQIFGEADVLVDGLRERRWAP